MRLLVPGSSGLPVNADLDTRALALAYAAPHGPWVRCNMVTTLDGAASGPDGRSGSINTEADHVVFELLRALSHVVVVGAGTVRAEGYPALTVADALRPLRQEAGLPEALPLVAVTRSADLPATLRDSPPGLVLLATTAGAPGLAAAREALGPEHVLVCGDDEVSIDALLAQLGERGWTHVLTEGGPSLVGSFLAAGRLDELCFTIAPRVVGGQHPRPVGPAGVPVDLGLSLLVEEDGTLLGRWVTRR
ncbi:deaminase/reductase [Intrasporangium oryzae NRRL B-24470]|uniref:Deaminase/reductase n=1 Tax=Intrasporangium oryzae NRRL B-24470 TaxID=1386089 RepID=W9GDI2_9MICO|nr:dihydrofolate reductase family protein [Intrasporangium oryzae]EWT01919.1 deaminase/reductase [Intrasporangium oryzae NRRL B-24470]